MSRVLITADIHFGLSGKLDHTLWAVQTMAEYAKQQQIETIFLLGDLFHDRVNTNIEVMNRVYTFLKSVRDQGQEWIAFPGNHDMFYRNSWKVNSLKPLEKVMTIINDIKLLKLGAQRFFVLPFIHYEPVYMKAVKELEKKHQEGDVLLTHVGVNNAILNECFLVKNWSVVSFEESKFDRVFAGHFHCHQQVEGRGNVWYPGSPIPYNFAEGSVPHGFLVYDTDSREVEFVDIFDLKLVEGTPPDYVTIPDTDLATELPIRGNNIRVHLSQEYAKDELFRIQQNLMERGAKLVKWYKSKEEKIDLKKNIKAGVSVGNPVTLFEKWVEHDKPKNLDRDLLVRLNEKVIKDGIS